MLHREDDHKDYKKQPRTIQGKAKHMVLNLKQTTIP